MSPDDTILAISSPPGGDGLRAIVRVSGTGSRDLMRGVTQGPDDHLAKVGWNAIQISLGHALSIPGAVLFFQAPRSYTGEDVAELHVPNSPALVGMLLDHLFRSAREKQIPARMAEPGEFTARAFLNGRMDLTEAEGVAATINAANETQLRAATRLRDGDLHRWIASLAQQLADLLALVEAGIDFSDEEGIVAVPPARLTTALTQMSRRLHAQLAAAVRIDRLALPPTIVFVGRPNVGKSSLINALSGMERSIVSPIAGTTRDLLIATMQTPRGDIRLLDVPGEESPRDELTAAMMAARQGALLDADLLVEVLDDPAARPAEVEYAAPRLPIWNKSDLHPTPASAAAWQSVSAKTGAGIAALRGELARRIAHRGDEPTVGATRLVLNHRHRELLAEITPRLHAAAELGVNLARQPELVAAEMRRALDLLGQITGEISPDEVLGRVFAQFCIGK